MAYLCISVKISVIICEISVNFIFCDLSVRCLRMSVGFQMIGVFNTLTFSVTNYQVRARVLCVLTVPAPSPVPGVSG